MTPELSVVIPVRDGERFLPDLFAALDAQTLPRDRFEVIVVDNNSRDRTPALLAAWADQDAGRRAVLAPGVGPAHARNVGVRHTTGRWIVFTDCDTIPEPEWLEAYARAAAANGASVLEGCVVAWPPEAVGPHTHQISNERGGKYVTANMAYRRDLLERLGGFDERFELAFLEDSDLAFRALDEGVTIPFVADARVRHRVLQRTTRDTLRSAQRVEWLSFFASKHPVRYRDSLRPHVQPLSHVDVRVLAGLLALAALPRTYGTLRLAAAALAADGLRIGAVRGRTTGSLFLSFALPVWKTAWWLDGCRRHRRWVW
jgi:glycosyltransferase involved in cell wall biosynthesis